MTIEVSVTNKDQHRSIVVEVIDYNKNTKLEIVTDKVFLKPQEGRTFYVHLLRDLKVKEVNPTSE